MLSACACIVSPYSMCYTYSNLCLWQSTSFLFLPRPVQISSSLTSLSLQINTTTATLNQLEATLNGTHGYSASYMGMDAYSLLSRAQNLNATAVANINRALAALTELRALHATAVQAWQDANNAQSDAMAAIVSLGEAVSDSAVTQSTLVGFMSIYDDNRMNLSYVDVVLTNTANQIDSSIAALLVENATLDAIYPAVLNLTDEYLSRYETVLSLEVAASDLGQAVQEAMSAAAMARDMAQELLVSCTGCWHFRLHGTVEMYWPCIRIAGLFCVCVCVRTYVLARSNVYVCVFPLLSST